MRLATWNVEWFNGLFDDGDKLFMDDRWSARHDVTRSRQTEAIATVMTALDADGIMIIEAPDDNRRRSTVRALQGFAEAFSLRARQAVIGFANDTQQEIAFLFDPDVLRVEHDPQGDPTGKKGSVHAPRFDGVFRIDLDIDATEDLVRFSKPPLELSVTAGDFAFRIIGAHLKSKAPHGAANRDEVMRLSISNRRKQLAQAIWLRARVAEHIDRGEALIVMGDLNDGPGLDEYEDLFGRSSLEIVMGGEGEVPLTDPHARQALQGKLSATPTTARFYIQPEQRYLQALLDYILVSPEIAVRRPSWRIWHPFDDPVCWTRPELRAALIDASDHFPVSIDIEV
ncbi:endonuclease/exonuclease/phosphatase family protein [Pseudooceanicola sp. LIPI14-2-Ac024]|uniref:endonuclease/exonuclease/phosphatase family protein n=1 Tax=Pseudooceanicola sp. LIPI14-2-Ac024 TaxID=3344875 RepID=UPI0035CF90FF